jgi:hypothetical protein
MLYKDRDCMADTEGWREITLDFGASDTQLVLTSAFASIDPTDSISQSLESKTIGKEMNLGKAWGLTIDTVTEAQANTVSDSEYEFTYYDNTSPEDLCFEHGYTGDSEYRFTDGFNTESLHATCEFTDDGHASSEFSETPLHPTTNGRSASSKAKETWESEHSTSWFPFDTLTRKEREIYGQMAEMM